MHIDDELTTLRNINQTISNLYTNLENKQEIATIQRFQMARNLCIAQHSIDKVIAQLAGLKLKS